MNKQCSEATSPKQVEETWKIVMPEDLITRPIIYELGKEFSVITNIEKAGIKNEFGIMIFKISGIHNELRRAEKRLLEMGVGIIMCVS